MSYLQYIQTGGNGWGIKRRQLKIASTAITALIIVTVNLIGVLLLPASQAANAATPLAPSGGQVTPVANSVSTSAGSQAYTGVKPFRIADTRPVYGCGNVTPSGPLGPNATVTLTVVGATPCESTSGSVPSSATAVVINVTVTEGTAPGFLTVFPTGTTKSTSSNLNWQAGQTVPNLVTVELGSNGDVSIYNGSDGTTNIIADVEGYFSPASSSSGVGDYQPISPHRICDTRPSNVSGLTDQCTGHTLIAGTSSQVLAVQVAGHGTLPVTGVSAVVVNVTAVDPSNSGFFTVYPAGTNRPETSTVNFSPYETVPNRAIIGLGTNGSINIYSSAGSADAIVDITGYYLDSSAPVGSGSLFKPISPQRICDTRSSSVSGLTDQCTGHTLVANSSYQTIEIQVAGLGGSPASTGTTPPTAVVLNVTVTDTTKSSYLTVYPGVPGTNSTMPTVSDLNWTAGVTRANMVVATMAPGGTVDLYNFSGSADVVVDVMGYYTAASTTWTEALPATPITGTAPLSGAPANSSLMYGQTVYDANTNEVILFGGAENSLYAGSNTTWTWNGSSWQQQSSAATPSPRWGEAMAYDPANDTVVMFGGMVTGNVNITASNSTWIWDGTNWTKASPVTSPAPGENEAMVYDAALGDIVLYTDSGNTWTWDGTNWTKLSPAASPGPLCTESMAYDSSSSTVLLFGGYYNSSPPSNAPCGGNSQGDTALDATWSFNGSTWTKLSPTNSPPARAQAAMAYDPNTSQIILFGGCAGYSQNCNALADTWTWDGTNWTQASPQSSPPGGDGQNGMAWDAGTDVMVMVGNGGSTWQYPTL